jgi:uncharacterized protein
MITNACFDIEIMNFLIENEFSLRISLDGPKEISEKQRNSNGQFDKIIENVKYLLENSLKIQFRLTATSLTKIYYKEVIDFFYENFGNCILQISPVSFLGNACENPNLFLSEEDYFVLIEKMTDYAGDRLTVNINGMCGFAENRKYYCNAINARQLVIKPDGIITSCTRDGKGDYFKIGTFDYKGAEFHMEGNAQKHIENTYNIDNISECNDCFAKSVCLGGCPMDRATDNKIHCDTIKGNLKEKLSLLIYKR